MTKKKIVVAISGGFDPLCVGHVRIIDEAKKKGTELVVIINNDNWLLKKRGFVFMPQEERKEILEALSSVDRVCFTTHLKNPNDMSVCESLKKIKPNMFANGGDKTRKNILEIPVCDSIGSKLVFSVGRGGKVQSSSWFMEKIQKIKNEKKQS